MSRPGFWDDPETAKEVSGRFSRVQGRMALLQDLRGRLEDSGELLELSEEDAGLLAEVGEELMRVERTLEEQEVARLFSGDYDEGDAILTINPGTGGSGSARSTRAAGGTRASPPWPLPPWSGRPSRSRWTRRTSRWTPTGPR